MFKTWLQLAGVGQLGLAAASLWIPRTLGWRQQLAPLRPLLRQIFWTYAAYIWGTNVCLGLVSLLCAGPLVGGGPLARAFSIYAALYWGARIGVQFVYFDRSDAPKMPWAEAMLVGLFITLAVIYGALAVKGG